VGSTVEKVASSLLAELVRIRIGMRGSIAANVALGRFADVVNCAFQIRRLRTEKKIVFVGVKCEVCW
jgi:alanine dehydrogenase